ncbi:MAG: efflux RND transporter periplasmic adaptor subunit [Thermoanaerobaculia bacterium]
MYIALAILVVLAAGFWFYQRADAKPTEFRFAEVRTGDVQLTVSATGTLSAVKTVSVGTQVSGQVAEILVDFNDRVKKGQLLARIDPTLAQQSVEDARATLESRRAAFAQAQQEYERNKTLLGVGLVAQSVYDTARSQYAVTRANVKAADVALDRANRNLEFTAIHAPIDGVVVERNVDEGQTVAASLSAPQLFLIANNLSQMQILASVDESDIAQISEGLPVKFTVQAMPNQAFTGRVRQVRLQSKVQENVVNYTVVVEVPNEDGKLLPGMTASVDFEAKAAKDVLTVPNAALRFTPPAEMLAELRDERGARSTSPATDSTSTSTTTAGGRGSSGGQRTRQRPVDAGRVWMVDENSKLKAVRVKTGISNGTVTEVSSTDLKPGMNVIVGVTTSEASASTAAPLGGNQQQQQRRGPGSF